jgi:8-oxo-dGTP pyrophosphatase MutT (NUDIX family)
MALPGGRRDDGDADLMETALREASEETGVVVPRAAVLGSLDEVRPRSARLGPLVIAPFVGVVPAETDAAPNPGEVEQALWVPLPLLSGDAAVSEVRIEFPDGARAFPSFRVYGHVIWGLTHRILTQFLELARAAGIAG